jgi:phosphopentomutase
MRAIVIVLDSCGVGAAPDAAEYGDEGSATLPHLATAIGGLQVPALEALGLGRIPELLPEGKPIEGVAPVSAPKASWGAMREKSQGKDTVTGHWELAGLLLRPGLALFPPDPPSFPPAMMAEFERRTGRGVLGNCAANGVAIMNQHGGEQLRTGQWIVYTSADSVFQICAHEEAIPLPELYRGCEIARELCDPLRVGRVIARPFVGEPGDFRRTENRRDFVFKPSEPTVLERLHDAGVEVCAVGKIEDIYAHRGITRSNHTGNNADGMRAIEVFAEGLERGLIFANFVDFDMHFGHLRDPVGYGQALRETDAWLQTFLPRLREGDLLILTADHGNDPTFKGSDHTREYVPLLVYRPGHPAVSLGVRDGFYDVAQSLAAFFGIPPMPRGVSFLC